MSEKASKLMYLEQPYCYEVDTKVALVEMCEDAVRPRHHIALEVTPYYPKRGGQDSETGTIAGAQWLFHVEKVFLRDGLALHEGYFERGTAGLGDQAHAHIDEGQRIMNMRLHTAGEVIIAALGRMGYTWKVVSAVHYKDQCRVVFEEFPQDLDRDTFQVDLNTITNSLVQENHPVQITWCDTLDEVERLCGFRPDYLDPTQAMRVVAPVPDRPGRPCMGAHVKQLADIGEIIIKSIKVKKGQLKVSYTLSV